MPVSATLVCYSTGVPKLTPGYCTDCHMGRANKTRQTMGCSGQINIYALTLCVQEKTFKENNLVMVAKFLVLTTYIS